MNYRVVILTAGKGSRLGNRTTYFNKAILKVGDKAVISHTIDSFPKETEFVIALGYKGNIVRQYLEIAYPEHKFIFVEIDKYSEPGAGPGYAMLGCKEQLQCPFYFVSCDSIIDWKKTIDPVCDWAAWADIDDHEIKDYCTIDIESSGWCDYEIGGYHNKSEQGTNNAFIGIAFIKNYQFFWEHLRSQKQTEQKEIQVAPSILSIPNIYPACFEWWDTGNEEGLQKAREHFKGLQNLDKADEELYFINNTVIKYFHNESMVKSRVARAQYLGNTIPKLFGSTKNFYKYEFMKGDDLFKVNNVSKTMESLLSFAEQHLWTNKYLNSTEKLIFKDACRDFYYQKTKARLHKLYEKLHIIDREDIINSVITPKIEDMFKTIDWDWLSDGLPSGFHGDWNLSNCLLLDDGSFKFVDWRQDFAGLIEYGDRYYDFGKMYHSFLMPHPSVKDGQFSIEERDGLIEANIFVSDDLQKAKDIFEKWIVNKKYDLKKVKVLTGIILLNMAPLHEKPLDKYLFYFAKKYLYDALNETY